MRGYEGLDPSEADLVFLEDMHVHHMHAIMQSRMLLRRSIAEHDDVEDLADSIIRSQMEEIGLMRDLYSTWYADDRGRRRGRMGR